MSGSGRLTRISAAFALLGAGALWSYSLARWGSLPASIPLHFDLAGRPTRWGPPSAANWFSLPAIGSALGLLLVTLAMLMPRWARSRPQRINLPDPERFRGLPPERRAWVMQPLAAAVAMEANLVLLLFAAIAVGVERTAATGGANSPLPLLLLVPMAVTPMIGVAWSLSRLWATPPAQGSA